jgi:2-hydroxy-6-oxonona-2,4-dienedioate hydrolase
VADSAASLYRSPEAWTLATQAYDQALAAWPLPPEARYLETRFGPTHVLSLGPTEAPPLVYFHGWGASAASHPNEMDLPRLARRYRLIMPDTIGQQGRSAPVRPPTRGPAYGEWAIDVLNGLGLGQVFAAGISGGGYLALKTAAQAPERVLKALILSPAGLTGPAVNLRWARAALPVVLFPSARTARNFVAGMRTPGAPVTPQSEAFAGAIQTMMTDFRYAPAPEPLSDEELRRISSPVRVLVGDDDIIWPIRQLKARARALIARIEVVEVARAGHILTLDRPGLLEAELLRLAD